MRACQDFAVEFYGRPENMRSSIEARAAFENRPIEPLFQMTLWEPAGEIPNTRSVRGLATVYRASADTRTIARALDIPASESMRDTEALRSRGSRRRLCGGGIESQIVVADGTRFAVRSGSLM